MFKKILIANRGEIACRVIRSAKKMGISTMAVYSEADRKAQHVKQADEAVCIGPAPSVQSYLKADTIVNVCKDNGVDGVHPCYGFLSENCDFQADLLKNGIKFIGPSSEAIWAMGDKIQSKKIANEAGVNMIPGFIGEINDIDHAKEVANDIGYPVMIKATAGGGGKGMRIVWNDEGMAEGYKLAKDEAAAAFGNDLLMVEKYVEEPKHIELQILADSFGNTVYLNERECSVQRRNQKVIEEAPSPFVDPELRKSMGEQAVALAKGVNYESSGTVEFLVDKYKKFYFLEMNTRLQVEHPITECITNVDIVEEMIRIAAGEKLRLSQKDIGIDGHAIEARVYAEDPVKDFMPSVGHLITYEEPANCRVDSGVKEGDQIQVYYDPIISKVVAVGKDRAEAIEQLKIGLDKYIIRGVAHNAKFCRDILSEPRFVSGEYTTAVIGEAYPEGFVNAHLEVSDMKHLAQVAAQLYRTQTKRDPTQELHYVVKVRDRYFSCLLEHDQIACGEVTLEDQTPQDVSEASLCVEWDGYSPAVTVNEEMIQIHSNDCLGLELQYKGAQEVIKVYSLAQFQLAEHLPEGLEDELTKELLAPMAGSIVSVDVTDGEEVTRNQELLIIEAMKMQNVIRAEQAGKVKKVFAKQGTVVAAEELLVEFE